jgi:hypothetical protein
VPRNRLRFEERAFAVDRLEGFGDACSEIRHVTLSASDIDDHAVWTALVKVIMHLRSSGKGYRKPLSNLLVALELESCVCVGIAVVSNWQRRWRSSCHGVAPSSKTKSQTKTSALVAAWDHRITRWAATANELDSSHVEVPVGTLLSGLSVFLQPSCKSAPQKWKSSH